MPAPLRWLRHCTPARPLRPTLALPLPSPDAGRQAGIWGGKGGRQLGRAFAEQKESTTKDTKEIRLSFMPFVSVVFILCFVAVGHPITLTSIWGGCPVGAGRA